jgi:hypothetical protein
MSLVKELHAANDLAQSRRFFLCKEEVGIVPSSFATFSRASSYRLPFSGSNNGSKFHKQLALFLFGDQMRIKPCQDGQRVIRRRQPFPYGIFVLPINADAPFKSLFNIFDNFWLAIACFYRSAKAKFLGRLRFAFPTIKTAVSFHKACKPLEKFFIGNNCGFNFKFFQFAKRRNFASRNFAHKFFSFCSSFLSRQVKIFAKKKELRMFDYGKFLYFGDESFLVGCQSIPGVNIFFMFSFPQTDVAAKIVFKKICGLFASNCERDSRIASRGQRNTPFGIKKTCKITHHRENPCFSSIMTGNDVYPQRLNVMEQG